MHQALYEGQQLRMTLIEKGSDIANHHLRGVMKILLHIEAVKRYTPDILVGRQIIGCVNLGEKNIAGFLSQFLLVEFNDGKEGICLATVDPIVPNGQKLH